MHKFYKVVIALLCLAGTALGQVAITSQSGGSIQIGGGGAGGIVPGNPAASKYHILGDSRDLSSSSSSTTITVTAVNCNGSVCIMTASNSLVAGDWVAIYGITSPSFLSSVNPYIYQVLSAGLSSSQFEIAYTANTGTGTGGVVYYFSYVWPSLMANMPYFAGHGSVLNYNPTSGETIANLTTFYEANIHTQPVTSGVPEYVFILAGYDDLVINGGCSSSALSSMETNYETLWEDIHADGRYVVMLTNPANSHASDGGACNDESFYYAFQQLNLWTKAQAKTSATSTSGAYWDYLVDAASQINADQTHASGPLFTQSSNGPHFTDAGNELIAQTANATLIQGASLQLKTQCANGDGCPNMQQSNWWIPATTNGDAQQIQNPSGATHEVQWETNDLGLGICAGMGFHTTYSTGLPGWWADFSGTSCAGGNFYPFEWLYSSTGVGGVGMPSNIDHGWTSADGEGTIDTNLSRDSAGVIDVGTGSHNSKAGAMQMAWIALGGATHVSGHSFDCSGTNCPGSGFTAGGDLSGTSSSQEVIGIHSVPLCTGFSPTAGQLLAYTTSSTPNPCWTPQTAPSGSFSAGGDLSGTSSSQEVVGVHSVPLCTGFSPTNGQNLQYTTGSSPNPCWTAVTGSSGGFAYSVLPAPPNVSSGWTWANQLSSTANNNGATLLLARSNQSTNSTSIFTQSVPGSTSWSVQAFIKLIPQLSTANGNCGAVSLGGLVVYDGTKAEDLNVICYQGSNNGLESEQYSTLTGTGSVVANYGWQGAPQAIQGMYLELCDDGTNLRHYYSVDGVNYFRVYTEAVGSFLGTITGVGFSILNEVGSGTTYLDVLGYQVNTTGVTCP